jgi:CSLREA domain-containing protein
MALVCALSGPATASAESFEVNSVADETEASLGDFVCQTAAGKCTLRAAIEEANSSVGEFDVVGFDEALFNGQVAGTIALGSELPAIVDPIGIEGECVPVNDLQPCVGVAGPDASHPALSVKNTEEVEIDGLAISGAKTGVEVIGTTKFKALNDWFGVRLDGSAGGNGTGVLLGPGSDRAKIGNGGFINVFAHNAGAGLDILGASSARVIGNYFGVGPDGGTPAPNGKDIEVTAKASAAEATGTAIGSQLTPQQAATPACDGGCNVISGSGSSGIDLEGETGEEEAPAVDTAIVGNYVGLDASGTAAVPNAAEGIRVGGAARTSIGGPRASESNRFAGGDTAVLAGPAAANLVVRGNSIGLDAAGAATVAPPEAGLVVNSEGLASVAAEATIFGNEIRMEGGIAIGQKGPGAWIAGNWISGAGIGIAASGEAEEHGNLIEGNLIERSELNAILLENQFNEALGNEVVATGGAGIRIHGLPPFGVSGNRVGGDFEGAENTIFGSGLAAIEIADVDSSLNEVARNRGAGNGGPFIDLVATSPGAEPKGPNGGIKPPQLKAVNEVGASGTAKPGAHVRVFRKASASVGELASFLGEAIADSEGNWKVAYETPIAGGSLVAATQTSDAGGTSELSTTLTVANPGGGGGDGGGGGSGGGPTPCPAAGAGACPGPPIADLRAPHAKILRGPRGKLAKDAARFGFDSDEAGSRFQCKLDRKPFKPCKSPHRYTGLKLGKHLFEVRAIDPAGNVGAPAQRRFRVVG